MPAGGQTEDGQLDMGELQGAEQDSVDSGDENRARFHQGCLAFIGGLGIAGGLYQACTAELSGGPVTGWSILVGVLAAIAGAAIVLQSLSRKTRRAIRKNLSGWWDFIPWV